MPGRSGGLILRETDALSLRFIDLISGANSS